MVLAPGTRLGPYEVTAQIGVGGMGEVYRATDTNLKRSVAIKVLPAAVASDAERLARFQREAEVLAALNHPNIAAIYGLERSGATTALVMELVEGPTLADRIAQGAIPIDEALPIAKQIAEALEAAHEQGIIHRDLKPANIKVREDGTVKVLDFGLAKAMEPAGSGLQNGANLTHSPTLSMAATQAGMILGTAAYMSPEQAKGLPADQRSDLFSFGVVLYEMLRGRQPFQGDTAPDVLASVLAREADLNALPPNLNPRIAELLKRCLEKNPRRRWQAVGDLRAEIEAIAAAPRVSSAGGPVFAPRPLWKRAIPAAASAVVAAALSGTAVWYLQPSQQPPAVTRFTVTPPDGLFSFPSQQLAISPDGSQLVYLSRNQLYLRTMSDLTVRPVQGVALGQSPVFSPDGRFIAFAAVDGTLKKIAVDGVAAVTICQADNPFGMNWGSDGIVFGQSSNIMRVSADGGKPELLISVKDGLVYGPQVLPGGQAVLFTYARGTGGNQWDQAKIVVRSLRSGEQKTLIDGGSDGRYLHSGHLVYALGGTLFTVAFDPQRLEVKGRAVPVLEGVRRASGNATGAAQFSVSNNGSLAYIPGPASTTAQLDVALTDRKGGIEPLKLPPGSYEYPRISPDGKHIALQTDDGKESVVWVYDLAGTSSIRRLTFGGRNRFPIWSADSQRVAFQSDREGDVAIWWQRADGTGAAERLTKPEPGTAHLPEAWFPKGDQFLLDVTKATAVFLWTFSLQDKKMTPFGGVQATTGNPTTAVFSPDGHWVAYSTDEGGPTTYVQPFPATGARYQLFSKPGDYPHHPLWSPDGKELLYIPRSGGFEAVSVSTVPTFGFGNPVPVPRSFPTAAQTTPRTFDITPDGKIVGVVTPGEAQGAAGAPQIQVVLNWQEELKQRVPTR